MQPAIKLILHLDLKHDKHTQVLRTSNSIRQTSNVPRPMQLFMVYYMAARRNDVLWAVLVLLCGHDAQLTLGFLAAGAASAAWA